MPSYSSRKVYWSSLLLVVVFGDQLLLSRSCFNCESLGEPSPGTMSDWSLITDFGEGKAIRRDIIELSQLTFGNGVSLADVNGKDFVWEMHNGTIVGFVCPFCSKVVPRPPTNDVIQHCCPTLSVEICKTTGSSNLTTLGFTWDQAIYSTKTGLKCRQCGKSIVAHA